MQRLLSSLLALVVLTTTAWGQASSSTVRGTVYDPANAVIPKANVTLTNTATNVVRTTTTNDASMATSAVAVYTPAFPGRCPLGGPGQAAVAW